MRRLVVALALLAAVVSGCETDERDPGCVKTYSCGKP
jgi:hypothetical protein